MADGQGSDWNLDDWEAFAVSILKLTPAEFWDLTWYDWGLYLLRATRDTEDRKLQEELDWAKWRELYALLCNIHRDPKKKPVPFKGSDFIKLSFDEAEQPEKVYKQIDDEYMERLKKRYSKKRVNGS